MPLLKLALSNILSQGWFWTVTSLVLCFVVYLARRKGSQPFPGVGQFLIRRKKDITRVLDIFIICLVLLWFLLPLREINEVISALSELGPTRTTLLATAWSFLFISLIIWSGWSGFLIGILSFFQSNLTKTKRFILLVVCLLPVVFTVLVSLMETVKSPWINIQICLYSSICSWIVNAPAIILGRHFGHVFLSVLRALHLTSEDFQ